MLQFSNDKQRAVVWVIITVLLAVGCKRAGAVDQSSMSGDSLIRVTKQPSERASVADRVCEKIFSGDFETARRIVGKLTVSDSQDLRELRIIINEYMAIKARREASRSNLYQSSIRELESFRSKGPAQDVNDIGRAFSILLKISEYADKEQKQALLKDPFLIQTIRKAKAEAAQFEAKGKWLDAYTICYSKLMQIYQDDKTCSDYAERLLEKVDISASLQDSPCQTSQERYTGIEKQMFINAVDVLNSSYVNIIDYRRMTIKAVSRCQLLGEIISNSGLDKKYGIKKVQFMNWLTSLSAILHEVNESPADISKDKFIDVFEQVLTLNESNRPAMKLPPALLTAQFAKGALSALDPYTAIYWPSQVQRLEKAVTNRFSGIGITFSKQEGLTKVVTVLPDTPAHKSGLQSGDIISAVDGIGTKDISSDCVAKWIVGPENTKVTLTIDRFGEHQLSDITINRAKITVPSVHGWQRNKTGKWLYMLNVTDKIGYVRISSFRAGTPDDFENVLCQLEENGLKGLILDLRSNPGGLLNAAVEIADKFIAEGLIVRTQPRFGMSTYISAHRQGTRADYPVVVLIDRFTASSAEILAGVLQDQKYKRAVLVGQRSYGKGSVQSITSSCGNGAQLKYTMAYYHLPSGRRVESRSVMEMSGRKDWGISPDVDVGLQTDELRKIADMRKANDSIARDDALGSVDRYSSWQIVDANPQLAIGLLVLKSKMIQAGHELAGTSQLLPIR